MAAALHWAINISPKSEESDIEIDGPTAASLLAAVTVKRAAAEAFTKKRRSTTSPDILEELGEALSGIEFNYRSNLPSTTSHEL